MARLYRGGIFVAVLNYISYASRRFKNNLRLRIGLNLIASGADTEARNGNLRTPMNGGP